MKTRFYPIGERIEERRRAQIQAQEREDSRVCMYCGKEHVLCAEWRAGKREVRRTFEPVRRSYLEVSIGPY